VKNVEARSNKSLPAIRQIKKIRQHDVFKIWERTSIPCICLWKFKTFPSCRCSEKLFMAQKEAEFLNSLSCEKN
jgi:hypothetical protein